MCEYCGNWARTFDEELLSVHHPDCQNRDIEAEAKVHIENLIEALEYEANMGDGITDEYFSKYESAKLFVGQRRWQTQIRRLLC
jgi:hypothetical protein